MHEALFDHMVSEYQSYNIWEQLPSSGVISGYVDLNLLRNTNTLDGLKSVSIKDGKQRMLQKVVCRKVYYRTGKPRIRTGMIETGTDEIDGTLA